MKLLALDQASRITGYTVFDNGKPIAINHFEAKGKDFAERLVNIRQTIFQLIQTYEIDTVAFEDIQLQKNVETFKMLAEVFGVVLELLEELKVNYYIVAPNVWKATFKIAGKGREVEKRLSQEWVLKNYGIKCSEDEADSACLGTHVIKKQTESFDWA